MYRNGIENLIRKRISVRKYSDRQVGEKEKEALLDYASALSTEKYRYVIIETDTIENAKIATYGYIKNAKTYLVAVVDKSLAENNTLAVQFGYDFEKIILKATDMGIDTCWMGAAYKEKELKGLVGASDHERVAMITPLGYREGRHLFEKITRAAIKADKRKAFEDLFRDGETKKALLFDENQPVHKALEMVRLAPSAGNVQPWRVVKENNAYHFYAKGAKFYETMKDKKINFTYNDMGIAKLHFELMLDNEGIGYEWHNTGGKALDGMKYIGTYQLN